MKQMKASFKTLPGVSQKEFQAFLTKQPVKKVYLFGSFARKTATAESDIDLVVELDYDSIKTGLEFFSLWDNLEHLTGRKVDLATIESLSKYALPDFERDKILIYERPEA
jgi:uncharacterized protein